MTLNDLDRRRRVSGLSVAELARRTGISYHRLWHSLPVNHLDPNELARIELAITAAETERAVYASAI